MCCSAVLTTPRRAVPSLHAVRARLQFVRLCPPTLKRTRAGPRPQGCRAHQRPCCREAGYPWRCGAGGAGSAAAAAAAKWWEGGCHWEQGRCMIAARVHLKVASGGSCRAAVARPSSSAALSVRTPAEDNHLFRHHPSHGGGGAHVLLPGPPRRRSRQVQVQAG